MIEHNPNCDVNDINPEGISKPCNCGVIETIYWHPPSEKPDTDTTVLMCTPHENEPVSLGYWDSANDMWTMDDAYPDKVEVTHWAHLPEGPKWPTSS